MKAFCYATGLIEFGQRVPSGAIEIARGPARELCPFIEQVSRHGYRTRKVNGRPTKIRGTDCLLVPGVPETQGNQVKGGIALRKFCNWIGSHAPKSVVVT